MNETEIYEQIDKELNGGGLIRSLWTRVYAEADGDEAKAKARYIKARVAHLMGGKVSSQRSNVDPVRGESRAARGTFQFVVTPNSLTKAQFSELKEMKRSAFEEVKQTNGVFIAALAGTCLSDGGRDKVLALLKEPFEQFLDALQKLPREPSPYSDEDMLALANVDACAMFYLAIDSARHRTPKGFFVSAKQREAGMAHDDEMDRIAFTVAQYLKLVRVFKKA